MNAQTFDCSAAATGHQAVSHSIGDNAGQEAHGADCVIVSGDGVVDIIRIAIRVNNTDNRNIELTCFQNSNSFFFRIDDENGTRKLFHGFDPAKEFFQFLNIFRIVECHTVSFTTIAACASRFLIISLYRFGEARMGDEADVRLVDTHTKCYRCHYDIYTLHQEIILRLRTGC